MAVTELFNNRRQWYSNRPASVSMEMITNAKLGQSKFTLTHDYDGHLRMHHRTLSPRLGLLAAPKYQPLMEFESTQSVRFLQRCNKVLRRNQHRNSIPASRADPIKRHPGPTLWNPYPTLRRAHPARNHQYSNPSHILPPIQAYRI